MKEFRGIDVSAYQNNIDWKAVKKGGIDFAIIRAGYGQNIKDVFLENNISGCKNNGIHFGLYWFSYALDTQMAINEANYICDIADKYNPDYPICFDYEYDSYNYAVKKGKTPNVATMVAIANAFLKRVEERGYYAMFYSNYDYLNRVFNQLLSKYDIWYALWGTNKGSIKAGMWQYSSKGKINGIFGNVDLDMSYKDYPTIIANMKKKKEQEKEQEKGSNTAIDLTAIKDIYWNKYVAIAKDVIRGMYGNGNERVKALKAEGYDSNFVQAIVDCIMR